MRTQWSIQEFRLKWSTVSTNLSKFRIKYSTYSASPTSKVNDKILKMSDCTFVLPWRAIIPYFVEICTLMEVLIPLWVLVWTGVSIQILPTFKHTCLNKHLIFWPKPASFKRTHQEVISTYVSMVKILSCHVCFGCPKSTFDPQWQKMVFSPLTFFSNLTI